MIVGIGTDLIETDRIKKACEKDSFLNRVYTEKERELFGRKIPSLAGNFAVKEAVSKCFGTGFRKFELTDIEVLRDELGKPYVNLYGPALALADKLKVKKIHVSITNVSEYAQAFAVMEGEEI